MQIKNEIDFFSLANFLWKSRLKILAGAFGFSALAAVYAFITPDVYDANAIISPQDNGGSGGGGNSPSALLSQLGGFGGAVASQFGLANTNLDRMEIMLHSRALAARVLDDHDSLLQRLYPKRWDSAQKQWKGPRHLAPNRRSVIESLRNSMVIAVEPRKKTLTLSINSRDSTLCADLVSYYLSALGAKIAEDTRSDADGNRAYLEKQLMLTDDPLLRERIQGLMAVEIEKSMLVSSKAFDILEGPVVPMQKLRPKRRQIVLGAFVIGLILSSLALTGLRAYAARKGKA